jgi:hypothetical protein
MILYLLACATGPLAPTEPDPLHDGAPVITSVDWGCDVEDSRWRFVVKTEQWSGGGRVWLGRSSNSNESHPLPSVEAAADGSADKLQLSLSVANDWRNANSGSSSQFQCQDQWALNYIITVQNTDKDQTTDCRIWGENPEMWSRIDVAPACETFLPWEPPADTGEGGA